MIERFSKESSDDRAITENFTNMIKKGLNAPHHEAFSLLLLVVKVALCQSEETKQLTFDSGAGGGGRSDFSELLNTLNTLKVLQAKEVIEKVRHEVNKTKVGYLKSCSYLTSVGGISPKINNDGSTHVLAHGELGVVALTDSLHSENRSFEVRVQCSGGFQVGWAHCGLDFSENVDLRKLDGCCVYDGSSVWSERNEQASSPDSGRWKENDLVTCTLDSVENQFIFSRNGCDLRVSLPAGSNAVRWRPVLSLVKDGLDSFAGAMYPSVCESMFHKGLYLEPSPINTWTWGKGSKGVQADNGVASTNSLSQSIVLGNSVLATGVHQWTMDITGELTDVKVGTASEDILGCLDKVSSCKEVYLWTFGSEDQGSSGQFSQSGRRKKRESIPSFKIGDKVQIEVDISKGRITFARNDMVMKVISDIRSCGWVPIAYFGAGAKIELTSQHVKEGDGSSTSSSTSSSKSSKRKDKSKQMAATSTSTKRCLMSKLSCIMGRCIRLTSSDCGLMVPPALDTGSTSGSTMISGSTSKTVNDFSLSVWLHLDEEQITEPSPWLSFLLKGNDFKNSRMPGLFVRSKDMTLALCITTVGDWNTTLRSIEPLQMNKWTHVGVTYHNKVCCLFIDGKLVNSLELSTLPIHNEEPWYLGKCPAGVKKACAEYPGISGHVSSLFYGARYLEPMDMASLASRPPTLGIDFTMLGTPVPTSNTRLRLGKDGCVSTKSPTRFPSNNFTLEALVVAEELTFKCNCLINVGSAVAGGFGFGVTNLGALYFNSYKREIYCGKNGYIVPGKLHHIAVVFGGGDLCFYVDGFAAGVHSLSHCELIDMPFSLLNIGLPGTSQGSWHGDVLDVRVWHGVRSQQQVAAGMSREMPICYESKVLRGKVPRCNNDHQLTISEGSSECRDCKSRY